MQRIVPVAYSYPLSICIRRRQLHGSICIFFWGFSLSYKTKLGTCTDIPEVLKNSCPCKHPTTNNGLCGEYLDKCYRFLASEWEELRCALPCVPVLQQGWHLVDHVDKFLKITLFVGLSPLPLTLSLSHYWNHYQTNNLYPRAFVIFRFW